MKGLRFITSWASIPHDFSHSPQASKYEAEIWVEGYTGEAEDVYALANACTIEWAEVGKLDPIMSSRAVLRLWSETDRQFYDLYTTEETSVRLDIYRDGDLYWSGTLDTESYEEPYATERGYEVELTFSDFAPLDRKKWDSEGLVSIADALNGIIDASGMLANGLDIRCSTLDGGQPIDFSALQVLSDNFYDEDGEADSLRDVAEAILQPFGLRMWQKAGMVHVADINSMLAMTAEPIEWASTDQRIAADKTYNNVVVTFSPYADTDMADGSLEHDSVLPSQRNGELYLTGNHADTAADGFSIVHGAQSGLPVAVQNGAQYYRIDSEFSGSDEAGVVWMYKGSLSAYNATRVNSSVPSALVQDENGDIFFSYALGMVGVRFRVQTEPIITMAGGFLSSASGAPAKLKIKLDLLCDVRYNPFEQASIENEEGNWDRLQNWANFAYIPVMLYLKDANGNITHHYQNRACLIEDAFDIAGAWQTGAGQWGDMWLAYYEADRKSSSGLGGWKTNKQSIGYYRGELPDRMTKVGDGELIPMPPQGGYLELQIGKGIWQHDYDRRPTELLPLLRWMLYKDPKIEVVKANGGNLDLEDVEDNAWIDRNAKEELSIDTKVGTPDEPMPQARGCLFRSDLTQARSFSRAGVTDRLERLLIGTAFSQYHGRKAALSGTARLLPGIAPLSDQSTEGTFIIVGETQNLSEETSQIKAVESVIDDYQGIDYE